MWAAAHNNVAVTPPSQSLEIQSDIAAQDIVEPALIEVSAKATPEASITLATPAQDQLQIWQVGLLGSTQKVADNDLVPMSLALGGYKVFKSNNPEIFTGLAGWRKTRGPTLCAVGNLARFRAAPMFIISTSTAVARRLICICWHLTRKTRPSPYRPKVQRTTIRKSR